MKRVAFGATSVGLLGALLLLAACGGSSGSSPSGPSGGGASSVCSEIVVGGGTNLSVAGCTSTSARIGPIRYVGSSSVVDSYDFDITCTSTGKRYTGTVNVASRTAVVNGTSCRF